MSSDPEEIMARVVVLGADAAGEWARPELEAFHLPSTSQSPHFLDPQAAAAAPPPPPHQEAEQSTPPAPGASPPPRPTAPLETEQPPPNAKPSTNDDKPHPPAPAAGLRDLFRFADGLDCLLMAVGTLGALVHGCSLPVFLRFFADLVDSFGSHADDPDTMVRLVVKYAFYFLVVGAAIWASSWAGNSFHSSSCGAACIGGNEDQLTNKSEGLDLDSIGQRYLAGCGPASGSRRGCGSVTWRRR